MSSNRVGGDFNSDAVEAFRAAYAAQLMTPQEQDVDKLTGLPTDTISNTSPWIESTGLWKYPSGKGPEEDLRAPFNPDAYYTQEESEEDGEYEEVDVSDLSREDIDEVKRAWVEAARRAEAALDGRFGRSHEEIAEPAVLERPRRQQAAHAGLVDRGGEHRPVEPEIGGAHV